MVNSIIEAIAIAINGEFGDSFTIYRESVKQGLKEPCFFIFPLSPTHKHFFGDRYYREQPFVIQYFPEDKQRINEECNGVADRLYFPLEYITAEGDLIRGTQMHYEIVDDVLHFFVSYDFFVRKPEESLPAMEELNLTQF